MNQTKDKKLDVAEHPTPGNEADAFSSPDEKAVEAAHKRNLEDKATEQGPFGKLIGSSDSSLNTCLILLLLGFIAIGISLVAMIWNDNAASALEKLITFELTIAGYVMGTQKKD
ncbi:hypothetical protein [Lentibacter sp. XHP0401]|uniref:hypothetical protein n=1 Tax=Lentibacter sp. XHP0401 TaxID=2984334 RepID=UPI0021E7CC93|nr:hypothetical protein [Lentibacter sp. XHP0401]MCV2893385.1 hypothetical protein [Lentibacter sp. XHP0401]